jgi:hypothetical protein
MRSLTRRGDVRRMSEVFRLTALSSPHVVRYFDAWAEADNLYIQTEYCPLGSAAAQVSTGQPARCQRTSLAGGRVV